MIKGWLIQCFFMREWFTVRRLGHRQNVLSSRKLLVLAISGVSTPRWLISNHKQKRRNKTLLHFILNYFRKNLYLPAIIW